MRQWTYQKLPCAHCQEAERIPGGRYCATCSLLCSRCRVAPKTPGHGWCSSCRAERRSLWRSDPQRAVARALVSQGLKRGAITKTPCVICGKTDVLAFIPDPTQRPVEPVFLCRKHHRQKTKERCASDCREADAK